MLQFFGDSERAQQAWAIIVAISASGSMVSVIYTCARGELHGAVLQSQDTHGDVVKQAIAHSNILPWSKTWARESRFTPSTPQGGLMLHWIFSVALISASSAISNLSEAIFTPGLIQVYAQGVVGGERLQLIAYVPLSSKDLSLNVFRSLAVFLSLGFPVFSTSSRVPQPPGRWILELLPISPSSPPPSVRPRRRRRRVLWSSILLAFSYGLFSLAIIIITVIPPYKATNGTERSFKGWMYPAVVLSLMGFACIYYCIVFGGRDWSVLWFASVRSRLWESPTHDEQFGNRRYNEIRAREGPVSDSELSPTTWTGLSLCLLSCLSALTRLPFELRHLDPSPGFLAPASRTGCLVARKPTYIRGSPRACGHGICWIGLGKEDDDELTEQFGLQGVRSRLCCLHATASEVPSNPTQVSLRFKPYLLRSMVAYARRTSDPALQA